jgi:outer membrane protein assembly factor BamD (BamD/ComL family)
MQRSYSLTLILICLLASGCATHKVKHGNRRIHQEALEHYHMGIDSYTNSSYAEAIRQWKITLKLDPNFPNARNYILRAEKADKTFKAMERDPVYMPVSPDASN